MILRTLEIYLFLFVVIPTTVFLTGNSVPAFFHDDASILPNAFIALLYLLLLIYFTIRRKRKGLVTDETINVGKRILRKFWVTLIVFYSLFYFSLTFTAFISSSN